VRGIDDSGRWYRLCRGRPAPCRWPRLANSATMTL